MTPLASLERFAQTRGVRFDPTDVKAIRALEGASAFIRARTGQTISRVTPAEEPVPDELAGNWSHELWLPQRPVNDVVSVSLRGIGQHFFRVVGISSVTWNRRGRLLYPGSWWGGPDATIEVVYDHGWDEIPADIETICLAIAARLYATPVSGQAVTSKSIGAASVSYATDELVAAAGVTAFEEVVLKRYAWQVPA